MTTLVAYHGDAKIKTKYLNRVKAHQKADEIQKGFYWEGGKGCAIGCTIEGSDHSLYETELGIPKELAYLEDFLFEAMPNNKAKLWPAEFLRAIRPGADLSEVVAKFVIWQFEDSELGLKNIKEIQEDREVYGFCEEVVNLYKRTLTETVNEDEFYQLYLKIDRSRVWARAGARAGAWAWAGAWARARAGARAWARAGAWVGAEAGAWVGAEAGDRYNNRIIVMADKLIELLKEAN